MDEGPKRVVGVDKEEFMNTKSDATIKNWKKLKDALQQEAANMDQAAGEKMVEVKLLSEYEMTLFHKKTFKGLNLTFLGGMDSLRVENSARMVNLTRIPDFVGSLAVDLMQALS